MDAQHLFDAVPELRQAQEILFMAQGHQADETFVDHGIARADVEVFDDQAVLGPVIFVHAAEVIHRHVVRRQADVQVHPAIADVLQAGVEDLPDR